VRLKEFVVEVNVRKKFIMRATSPEAIEDTLQEHWDYVEREAEVVEMDIKKIERIDGFSEGIQNILASRQMRKEDVGFPSVDTRVPVVYL